jgi:hypothetical protein
MHVKEISYTGTYHLGDHNFEKIACSFHLNEGEDEQFALVQAKKVVEDFHNGGRSVNDFNKNTFINQPLPDIQVNKISDRDKIIDSIIYEMNQYKDIKLFINYHKLLLRVYPEIKSPYEAKLIKLEKVVFEEAIKKNGGPY